jgi:hypothetical protein
MAVCRTLPNMLKVEACRALPNILKVAVCRALPNILKVAACRTLPNNHCIKMQAKVLTSMEIQKTFCVTSENSHLDLKMRAVATVVFQNTGKQLIRTVFRKAHKLLHSEGSGLV